MRAKAGTPRSRWQRVALRLGERLPVERLHPAVRAFGPDAQAQAGDGWVLACSGGSDSVALVLLVWAHWPERRSRMVVAHFDHRLRGRESTNDARFCASLAGGLGVKFAGGRWENAPNAPSETTAREARNAFLETVRQKHRAPCVWTGHQRDDVAETLLMRLARGSGTAGLAAPRPVQKTGAGVCRLRPLLDLGREELCDALIEVGARWREDTTNTANDFFRNRVRADVIPVWVQSARRDAVAGAGVSRALLEEDDAALELWLNEIDPIATDGRLSLKRLAGKPMAIWRRALYRWLLAQEDIGDLSRAGFDALLALARDGGTRRFSLGRSGFVRIRRGWLFFEKLST